MLVLLFLAFFLFKRRNSNARPEDTTGEAEAVAEVWAPKAKAPKDQLEEAEEEKQEENEYTTGEEEAYYLAV